MFPLKRSEKSMHLRISVIIERNASALDNDGHLVAPRHFYWRASSSFCYNWFLTPSFLLETRPLQPPLDTGESINIWSSLLCLFTLWTFFLKRKVCLRVTKSTRWVSVNVIFCFIVSPQFKIYKLIIYQFIENIQ